MKTISVQEAKTHLSQLIDDVISGNEVVISRRGVPVVALRCLDRARPERRLGSAKGLILAMGHAFDDPLPDFADYMPAPAPVRQRRRR